jgi:hypothetical protein
MSSLNRHCAIAHGTKTFECGEEGVYLGDERGRQRGGSTLTVLASNVDSSHICPSTSASLVAATSPATTTTRQRDDALTPTLGLRDLIAIL